VVLGQDIGNKVAYPVAAGCFSQAAKHCGCHTSQMVLVRHRYRHVGDFSLVTRPYIVRGADQPACLKRADHKVGTAVFDQPADPRVQEPGVDDKEPVVALAIGEVAMKQDQRFGVVFIETAQLHHRRRREASPCQRGRGAGCP
jgi:hypothetical protein